MRFLLVLAVLAFMTPILSQDDPCNSEAILDSFAEATDMTEWAAQYSECPGQVRRAVNTLAAGFQMLNSEYLPFAAADDPFAFSPIWKWYQGKSVSMVHNIDPEANIVTLIADSFTKHHDNITTAPVLAYPVNGDVTAQVKLTFRPLDTSNGAGLGIRDAQDLNNWIRITRVGTNIEVTATTGGISELVEVVGHEDEEDELYLKIERVGTLFTLSFSVNGDNWNDLVTDYTMALPTDSEVFLTTFWPVEMGAASARFSEMKVEEGN